MGTRLDKILPSLDSMQFSNAGENGTVASPNNKGFQYFYGYVSQENAHNYYPPYLWRNEVLYKCKYYTLVIGEIFSTPLTSLLHAYTVELLYNRHLGPDIFGHFLLQYRGLPLSEDKNVLVRAFGTKNFVFIMEVFSIVSLIRRVC